MVTDVAGSDQRLSETLRYAAFVLASLAAVTPANAASFFNEKSVQDRLMSVAELREVYSTQTIRGVESIVIDDMVFPIEDVATLGFTGKRWTGGVFVYQFDSGVTAFQRGQFLIGCGMWDAETPVSCRERTTESVYYTIYSGESNRSNIGMQNGFMEIYNWGWPAIIAHEIAHALGSKHEQSRPDRNQYVTINEGNIEARKGHNFWLDADAVVYTPYDFDSVMHYGACDFSVNPNCRIEPNAVLAKKTIVPVACDPADLEGRMGQRTFLSDSDKLGMSRRYGASVMSLFKFSRHAACGTERLTERQKKKICDENSENCAAAAAGYRAIEEHRFKGCDDGFFPPLGRCRSREKVRFFYHHREGARCGIFQLNHIQHYKWKCGCPVFSVNAACTANENGLSDDGIDRYRTSDDPTERALGRFGDLVQKQIAKERIEPELEFELARLLLVHDGHEKYDKVVNKARRKMCWKIFWRRVFFRDKLVTVEEAFTMMEKSG